MKGEVKKTKKIKETIGRLEKVDLPSFDLFGIDAKIDTGAYNGSIHVSSAQELESDGRGVLKFVLLDENHPEFDGRVFEVPKYEKKIIKDSSGTSHIRYLVPLRIILKDKELNVKLSLSNRSELRYPILLGRKAIKRHFIIDASKKFTS